MVVLRRFFFSVLCPSLCISLFFASSFVSQVLLSTTGRTVAAGGGSGGVAAMLLLLLRKDISPCVFSFVVYFLFSFFIRFRFLPLCHCSSPLFFYFGRWWCCQGWLGGTVEAMVEAMRTTAGDSSSPLLCSVSLFSVFKCSPSFLFSKPSPPLLCFLFPPCIYR
jgi:hypothetical protein